ncbi:hypothetical protein LWI29_014136 [Acer saccharum]|uniref:C-JID domain-containing protein n=1 Tax=Acer saccharum TaxID=4024 RepID=A0AA39SI08_ACESA|nr:hypothetical protein LWI29_014136 [Acer saccharum]
MHVAQYPPPLDFTWYHDIGATHHMTSTAPLDSVLFNGNTSYSIMGTLFPLPTLGPCKDDLYQFSQPQPFTLATTVSNLWHLRLSHPSPTVLRRLGSSSLGSDFSKLPSDLQYLEAVDCEQLQSLPDASEFASGKFGTLTREVPWLMELNFLFTNCLKLNEKALSSVLAESLLLIIQHKSTIEEYEGRFGISMCYPGSEIPDWFSYRCSESIVNIQLPPHKANRRFLGFALCVVIELKEYYHGSSMVNYKWHSENNQRLRCMGHLTIIANRAHKDRVYIDSDHVL